MANRARSGAAVLAAAASLAILAAAAPQATGGDGPGLPKGSAPEGDPTKFDYGFYEKIQDIISAQGGAGHQAHHRVAPDDDLEYVVPVDTTRYYHTVMVVSGDGQEAVDRNKAALVAILEEMGARDIYPGRVLSFVTARVPVDLLPGLSLYGEVAALGDEELPVTPNDDRARLTIRANLTELAALAGRPLNGSGVTVGIVDSGINSIFLNDKVVARNYCPDGGCWFANGILMGNHTLDFHALNLVNSSPVSHGTSVAHVIAATGLSNNTGMAPGVSLVDANYHNDTVPAALDYALVQGAGVINMSIDGGIHRECHNIHTDARSRLMNGVVINGTVLVQSAGNSGYDSYLQQYDYSSVPGCTANHIVVGGLYDRGETLTHWNKSSKGPTNDEFPRLAPHIVAPAVVEYVTRATEVRFGTASGTSYSAPMVSAAAALMLQLKPDLVPTETKSLLLLGANWTGPVPCTSRQYEQNDPDDGCSYAARPGNTSLRVLNHVGFGVLDVHRSLSYAKNFSSHVLTVISPETSPLTYGLNVTGSPGTVKVLLTWLVKLVPVDEIADLDLSVTCPWSDGIINAGSTYQTVEFAVFEPDAEGVCVLTVAGSGVNGTDFTLAATHPITSAPSQLAVRGITVSSPAGNNTYLAGETVRIAVTFPRAVQASDGSPPYLSLETDPPGGRAAYTGTDPDGTTLTFVYQAGDNQTSSDLDYTGTDALVLPDSDSITDAFTGIPIRPDLPSPGEPGSLGHANDIAVDGTQERPAMSSAETVHPTGIAIHFNKPVDAGRTDGAGWTLSGLDAGSPPPRITANTDPDGSLSTINLTLSGSLPAGASDLSVAYEPPSSGGIADQDGNPMAGASISVDDRIRPVLAAVSRDDPPGQLTVRADLSFAVTFSEPVNNVDRFDFEPSGPGTVTGVDGSGSSYLVNVTAHGSGSVGLGVSPSHDIADPSGNLLADTGPDPDHTYLVDLDPPSVSSITRSSPIPQATNQRTLTFQVTFSEPVTGVTRGDFALSDGPGQVTGVTGSGSVWDVTVRAASSGTFDLDIIASNDIADPAGNPLTNTDPPDSDQTYLVDLDPPSLTGITRLDPLSGTTNHQTLTFQVTFSEPVNSVDAADFTLSRGPGQVTGVAGSGSTRDVTVRAASSGTFDLDISPSRGIEDLAGNRLTNTDPPSGSPDQTYLVDLDPPSLTGITRHDPSSQVTSQMSLTFRVSFGEPVENVDAADFALSNGSGQVAGVAGSGSTRDVTVRASSSGTFDLDIIASNDIADPAGNPLTNTDPPSGRPDQTYTVDASVPSVAGIVRHDPADRTTARTDLVFRVNFSEPVTGVDPADFELSRGTGSVTGVNGSGATWDVAVRAASSGVFDLDVSTSNDIVDAASKRLSNTDPPDPDETYLVDLEPPSVASIVRHDPTDRTTSRTDLVFRVNFSEPVTGVDPADFELSRGTGSVTGVTGSGATWDVAVAASSGGTFDLDVSTSNDIVDGVGRSLSNTDPPASLDQTYLVDLEPPSVAGITRHDPASQLTHKTTLVFRVAFSEPVAGVDRLDFEISGNGSGTVTGVTGSGSSYRVAVSATSDGSYGLEISPSHNIADPAGNPLPYPAPSSGPDQTYTVDPALAPPPPPPPQVVPPPAVFATPPPDAAPPPDTAPPAVVSIGGVGQPGNVTNLRTLVFNVTFSEPVAGVDPADFALTADGDPGPLSHTRSPALAIPDRQTTTDTITVDRHGTVASVIAGLNITHLFTTDLTVQLVAPDGTARTLHNGTLEFGGGVFGTRQPDFNGTEAAGNWTLAVWDAYAGWTGTLNRWNLTINYSPDPGRLLQESEPALGVADPGVVQDTVTVDRPGIAESAAIGVNITHQSVGDLGVELVRPDGLVLVLHNRTGGPAGGPAGTYLPDLAGADILGNWTLRVVDGVEGGNGTLHSWSLAINYSSAGMVTALNGSGPSYLVTARVPQDGAYRLGIVPGGHGIADAAGNPLNATIPPAVRHAYLVDTLPPALLSISGAAPPDGAAAALFNITFSEPVTGVDPADFALSPPWAGYVSNLTGSGPTYLVAAANTAGNGTALYLALIPEGHGIADAAGNGLADAAGPTHRAEAAPRTPSRTTGAAAAPRSRDGRTGPPGDGVGDHPCNPPSGRGRPGRRHPGRAGDCPGGGRTEAGR